MASLAIAFPKTGLKPFPGDEVNQVAHAGGISPLVVVPRDHLHAVVIDYACQRRIHAGGTIVAAIIHGNEFFRRIAHTSIHRPPGSRLTRFLDASDPTALLPKHSQL